MTLDYLPLILAIALSSCLAIILKWLIRKSPAASNKYPYPPGPNPWPIIGNLHQLGQNPHRSLAKLSKTYGPLMHLRLGSVHAVVVSSPEAAREFLHTHDRAFSGRTVPDAVRVMNHDRRSVAWLGPGAQWRKFRKICKEELFSAARLASTEPIRRAKAEQMRDYLNVCCDEMRAVNVGELVYFTALNITGNTLFSADLASYGSDSPNEVVGFIRGMTTISAAPNVSDYFSILRRFDPQGIRRRSEACCRRFLGMFDGIIDRKMGSSEEAKAGDMLDVMIEISLKDESFLSREEIKHLLMELMIGGVDSTSTTVEWAMTELLRNPEKLSKAKDELEAVIGNSKQVEESDIPRLSYLNAVVKETLRMHPPGPFLVPHRAEADVEIDEYTIPKGASVLFNVWAIGRDPRVWSSPDVFEPERFLRGRNVDYRGNDFELIPFGSGRRMCPGIPLAHATVHLMVGSLIHRFDWRFEEGVRVQSLDVAERFGLVCSKAKPLMAIPSRC